MSQIEEENKGIFFLAEPDNLDALEHEILKLSTVNLSVNKVARQYAKQNLSSEALLNRWFQEAEKLAAKNA